MKFKIGAYLCLVTGLLVILSTGCRNEEELTPEQLTRAEIMANEEVLQSNDWNVQDLRVTVAYEIPAIPLLVNVANDNGMVMPGVYDSYAIFGNSDLQLNHTYNFTRDDVMLDSNGLGEFHKVGGYFLLNLTDMRLNLLKTDALRFSYNYQTEESIFTMTSEDVHTGRVSEAVDQLVIDALLSGNLDDFSSSVISFIGNNEHIAELIESFLYDLIHGKIAEISNNPEKSAELLANKIVELLEEVDWETLIYDASLSLLESLQVDDPEATAEVLSQRISDKISASFSSELLYDMLLPVLETFEEERLPVLATRIAELVYTAITVVLSEENIYNKIYPIWEQYSAVDSSAILALSDTLAGVASSYFFAADTLAEKLMPFVAKIDETKTFKLGELSQEIIDSVLVPTVDRLNGAFPGLDLEPDYASIKPVITSVLTALKVAIGASSVEELSATLANSIIGIMNVAIEKGFEKAFFRLQEIPSEQASSVLAAWISNLVEMTETIVVDFIEAKLNEVFEHFEADESAVMLSELIHNKLVKVFSEENIYQFVLPILVTLKEADAEKISEEIADWITDSDIISDNLSREELVAGISMVMEQVLGDMDPDNVSEQLVDLLLQNDLVTNLDGVILSKVLEIKAYQLFLKVKRNINSIEKIEITLIQK